MTINSSLAGRFSKKWEAHLFRLLIDPTHHNNLDRKYKSSRGKKLDQLQRSHIHWQCIETCFCKPLCISSRPWKVYVKMIYWGKIHRWQEYLKKCMGFFVRCYSLVLKIRVHKNKNITNNKSIKIQNILFNTIRFNFCNNLNMTKKLKNYFTVESEIKGVNKKTGWTSVNKSWDILKIYLYFNIATRGGIL